MSGYGHHQEPQVQKMKVQGSVLIRPPKLGTSSHFSAPPVGNWTQETPTLLKQTPQRPWHGSDHRVTSVGFSALCPKLTAPLPLLLCACPAPRRASSLLQKSRSPPEPGASLMNFWPDMKSPQEC